jgi:S-adenosylmethionine:tRNA ribosyltransferase-isomerase
MLVASRPVQRPTQAKLLIVDAHGHIRHVPRSTWVDQLRPGDVVVANDAATLPASLAGRHEPTRAPIEVRLAGRGSLDAKDVHDFCAIIFGAGDFHTRTEDRPLPPLMSPGDRLTLGPLTATIKHLLDHPRLVQVHFEGMADAIWSGIARHGRPIQYAHLAEPLALWDVWTPIAGPPVAFEPPTAGFVVAWQAVAALRGRGVQFATLTHAAGISSTGDEVLDRRLPLDEPYRIPAATARAVARAHERGGRVVAIGTTVTRALEHAAIGGGRVRAGDGLANQRLGPASRLRAVDAILTGVHERATSHFELLRAFQDDATLYRVSEELDARAYRTHEFGDSVLIEARTLPGGSWISMGMALEK